MKLWRDLTLNDGGMNIQYCIMYDYINILMVQCWDAHLRVDVGGADEDAGVVGERGRRRARDLCAHERGVSASMRRIIYCVERKRCEAPHRTRRGGAAARKARDGRGGASLPLRSREGKRAPGSFRAL